MRTTTLSLGFALAAGAALLVAPSAHATSIIRDPNPPQYHVEIEPHLDISLFDYNTTGFGPGIRFSIPVMSPGFIKTINDSIAISFGADFLHYNVSAYRCSAVGCYDTTFWSLYFPVAMQWNFWLTDKWSVFGEPGLAIRHTIVDCGGYNCSANNDRVFPAFHAGARFHFSDTLALTMRAGYPTGFSIGLSIF
jgi:hypothetical protein